MPVYQYFDSENKEVVELIRTVAGRDNVPAWFRRITVPQRIGIYTGTANSPRDEHSAEYQVPRAYRQLEEKSHGREWLKESGFSVDEVRKTWEF